MRLPTARRGDSENVTAAHARLTSDPTPPKPAQPRKRPTPDPPPRADPPRAPRRPRLLYIFAGPSRPTDGFATLAAAAGYDTTEIDLDRGDPSHDMLRRENRARVLLELRARVYDAVLAATPCTTFSIAHGNRTDGAFQHGLRSARYPSGPEWLDAETRRLVDEHDALVAFSAEVLGVALDLDIDFILENPAPRDDPGFDSYWPQRAHLLQIWDTQPLRALRARAGGAASLIVVPQCAFGPTPSGRLFQKYTGLLASRRAAARLADLRFLKCNHARHDDLACGDNASLAAAYPTAMNDALVFALTGVRRTTPLPRTRAADAAAAHDNQSAGGLIFQGSSARHRHATGACHSCAAPGERSESGAAATHDPDARPATAARHTDPAAGPGQPQPSERPAPDRSISAGFIADGPALSAPVREALEAARARRRKWASFANLQQASETERRAAPFPDLLPQAGRTESPGRPSQPGAAARLAEFQRHLGRRDVTVEDLWLPDEWARLQKWMRNARRDAPQPSATFPQSSLVPLARGFIWDCRDPRNCAPMEPSTRHTPFPGARQIDRAAFRRVAAELGSLDADIIGQVGEGGVESRSRCELTTELHSHAPGLRAHPEAAAKAIDTELEEQWALGPFYYPPTVPIRTLPRDVIMQERSRVVERPGAEPAVEDYLKPRVTLNPSRGDDSVNAGIDKAEREVKLTTARDLGYSLALIDVPARDAGHGVAGYGIDMTSAYSFLPVQRLDWWQFAYVWFDESGVAHFRLLIRVGFGGAMSPRRFQSVSVIIAELARRWQADFDAQHTLPRAVRRWSAARRELQHAGALAADAGQLTASALGVYIDDLAGGCCDDDVEMPPALHGIDTAAVDLGELAAFAVGGAPLRRTSRATAHCVIAMAAVRACGLEVTPGKTEGGDLFVNLGLRLRLREGRIDCPAPKRRILLRDLESWRARVEAELPFERAVAERQVGRLGNLTQVLPELLTHISAGHRAANAGYVDERSGRRRLLASVPTKRGSAMHSGLSRLLPHAIAVISRNEGVPLAPRATFAATSEPGVLLLTSDASGEDGFGGWAFAGDADERPAVLSMEWPDDVREALRQFKLPAPQRSPGAPLLSMPAAELFTTVALAAAAADTKPHHAVVAVGDCDPAARALDAASSGTPQIEALLAEARASVRQWLGVAVPREWNLDADRLSHPAQLDAVLADARAAGLDPYVVQPPQRCWDALRAAMRLDADGAEITAQ